MDAEMQFSIKKQLGVKIINYKLHPILISWFFSEICNKKFQNFPSLAANYNYYLFQFCNFVLVFMNRSGTQCEFSV